MKNNKIIKAVIFDLSGTLVDFGSLATVDTMKSIFKSRGIIITNEIIKKDMGIKKNNHIKKILKNPIINTKWIKKYKKPISSSEFSILCSEFDNELKSNVKKKLNLIPNVIKIIKILKKNRIKTGISTGYPKKITQIILNYLKKKNIRFNSCVSDDEVKNSRPNPDMCIKNLKNLKIKNSKHCIKIDDSISGILEGKNAKMLTVGLISTGIQVGLSKISYKKKSEKNKKAMNKLIKYNFKKIGTNYVVENHFEFEKLLKKNFSISL